MSYSVFPSFHVVSLAFRLALVAFSLFPNCAITGVITFKLVTGVGINPRLPNSPPLPAAHTPTQFELFIFLPKILVVCFDASTGSNWGET